MVDDNGFSSLNYRTARRFRQKYMKATSREVERMLAEVSAMFRFGLMPTRKRLHTIIDCMRASKFENPALAIVAAHISYRLGELEQIYDMENYSIGGGAYTPYDFLLLTGRKEPAHHRRRVGQFPLLSPGWGLLPGAEFEVDTRLSNVVPGLAPSLWTFADPVAGRILADIVSCSSSMSHAGLSCA
jgi:hypothetical protein